MFESRLPCQEKAPFRCFFSCSFSVTQTRNSSHRNFVPCVAVASDTSIGEQIRLSPLFRRLAPCESRLPCQEKAPFRCFFSCSFSVTQTRNSSHRNFVPCAWDACFRISPYRHVELVETSSRKAHILLISFRYARFFDSLRMTRKNLYILIIRSGVGVPPYTLSRKANFLSGATRKLVIACQLVWRGNLVETKRQTFSAPVPHILIIYY